MRAKNSDKTKKKVVRDMRRRALVLDLMAKTGLSEPRVYFLIEHNRAPTNPLVRAVWQKIAAKHASAA